MAEHEFDRRRLLRSAAMISALAAAGSAVGTSAMAAPAVLPGTAGWEALGSHDDMLRATQLPAETAAKMSTDQLVSAVLAYPLMMDALAHNSVQHGFERVAKGFNGLSELLRRPNAGAVLARRYAAFDIRVPAGASELAAGQHVWQAGVLEMLLAQPTVLGTLSRPEREALLRLGKDKSAAKRAESAAYGEAGLEPTALLLGRAVAITENWDWRVSSFLRDGIAPSAAVLTEVDEVASAHLADPAGIHQVTGGFGTQDSLGTVKTPRGSTVAVHVTSYELTSAQITSYNNYVRQSYPSASRETNASRKYNCHSYAWYSTATTNIRWMDDPGDDKYMTDGSYTPWSAPRPFYDGMKLTWRSDDHSGINVGQGTYVRSKWGQLPRMYHGATYTPYDDSSRYPYYRSA